MTMRGDEGVKTAGEFAVPDLDGEPAGAGRPAGDGGEGNGAAGTTGEAPGRDMVALPFELGKVVAHAATLQTGGQPVLFFPLSVTIRIDRQGSRVSYEGRLIDCLGRPNNTATFAAEELAEAPPGLLEEIRKAARPGLVLPPAGRLIH